MLVERYFGTIHTVAGVVEDTAGYYHKNSMNILAEHNSAADSILILYHGNYFVVLCCYYSNLPNHVHAAPDYHCFCYYIPYLDHSDFPTACSAYFGPEIAMLCIKIAPRSPLASSPICIIIPVIVIIPALLTSSTPVLTLTSPSFIQITTPTLLTGILYGCQLMLIALILILATLLITGWWSCMY